MSRYGRNRSKYTRNPFQYGRYPRNAGAFGRLVSLLMAGGMWAWQNRDRIRAWLEQNPQVRDELRRRANTFSGRIQNRAGGYAPQQGQQSQQPYTPPTQGGTMNQPGYGQSGGSAGSWGTDSAPATGETRRMSPEEVERTLRENGKQI